MKKIIDILMNINYLSELISIIMGIVIGIWFDRIKSACKRMKVRKKRRKYMREKSVELEDDGIISLDHGDPFYLYKNLNTIKTDEHFYLSIPKDFLVKIHEVEKNFISRSESVLIQFNWELYAQEINVPNIKELVEKHRSNVAEYFLSTLKSGKTLFNGELFGVRHIRSDREGVDENARLNIKFYYTDYYTHLVMSAVYNELKSLSHEISSVKTITDINKYYLFTCSFGMNTLVLLDKTNILVLAKRSGELRNMEGVDRWHVSMNEGLTLTDIEANVIDLKQCVRRGLREELGIHKKNIEANTIFNQFGDLFFVKEHFEIGITNIVKIDMSYNEIKNGYIVAKDGELETTELMQLELSRKAINDFLCKKEMTSACKYNLMMLMGRMDSL